LENDDSGLTILLMAKVSKVDSGTPPSHLPKRFKVSIDGFFSGGFSITSEDGALIVRKGRFSPPSNPITPSSQAWQRFWDKMDLIGVWKWQKSYWNADVLDGIQWEVDIQCGNKRLESDGSNSYPREDGSPSEDAEPTKPFEEFEKALEELCGISRA
jgi:hypothetical protein